MLDLRNSIAYICARFDGPIPIDLLVKLLYLADCRSAITRGCQLTGARWFVKKSGPSSPDILPVIEGDSFFALTGGFGRSYTRPARLALSPGAAAATPSPEDCEVLDFVLQKGPEGEFPEFLLLLDSVYPVLAAASRRRPLDLARHAADWNRQVEVPA